MRQGLVALLVGTLFGAGLVVSGMTQPAKVISFLDIFGAWDPSLAFVMMGAIGVHFFAYRFAKHRTSPFLGDRFYLPGKRSIDRPLVVGSILFGMGWGLAGYCPGPALASLTSLHFEVIAFVAMMALGMTVQEFISVKRTSLSDVKIDSPQNN